MLADIRTLPLEKPSDFLSDWRNVYAAESCLRRALEALFDLGRHILAKGFALGITEYKEIALALNEHQIVSAEAQEMMRKLAGYRNRLVHFYHEVGAEELYEICSHHLTDVEQVANELRAWLQTHPHLLDETL
jgi:uncharacterized protein YutE (UPF0331/DUF86 family)